MLIQTDYSPIVHLFLLIYASLGFTILGMPGINGDVIVVTRGILRQWRFRGHSHQVPKRYAWGYPLRAPKVATGPGFVLQVFLMETVFSLDSSL